MRRTLLTGFSHYLKGAQNDYHINLARADADNLPP